MIGDRIVVSLPDSNLLERLHTNPWELTLNKAITMARRTKAVRKQQAVVRGEKDSNCTRIKAIEQLLQQKTTNYVPSQQGFKTANKKGCTRCSKFPTHPSAWLVKLHAISVKGKAILSASV